ncbi:hypothetical protein ASE37_21830 [Rhizobium sp. Root268]|nr:hypothetical protein ASC86_23260 [Rhizobium sp. Root1212]KRD35163.1 hypothetical protein ASE37_21830 [Rhizobium sp. Root268]
MERAFESHLDMAKAEIASADGISLPMVAANLKACLANAFHFVKPSNVALAAAEDVEVAFRSLVIEIGKTPLGMGRSAGVDNAKRLVTQRLDILRADLSNCPPSEEARALGID